MTAQGKIKDGDKVEGPTGLDLLRAPFPPHQIAKLPKPTEQQTNEVKQNFKAGIRCEECGQWHHPKVVHLDYVGHAALTDRLLDADPMWNWEPVAVNEDGTPKMDQIGGMWIRLTVCGMTRLGYGDAQGKKGPNAVKEVIGDALRNAAMRFGAALDLWHKGDLHGADAPIDGDEGEDNPPPQNDAPTPRQIADRIITDVNKAKGDKDTLTDIWSRSKDARLNLPDDLRSEVKDAFAAAAPKDPPNADLGADEIPF